MFTFFISIIIVYLIWLLIKPLVIAYARKKYTQKINEMFGQAFGQHPGFGQQDESGRQQRQYRPYPPHRTPKKKVFSREDGEYVEFEEIDIKIDYSGYEGQNSTHPEPQVSDADWEEIK